MTALESFWAEAILAHEKALWRAEAAILSMGAFGLVLDALAYFSWPR